MRRDAEHAALHAAHTNRDGSNLDNPVHPSGPRGEGCLIRQGCRSAIRAPGSPACVPCASNQGQGTSWPVLRRSAKGGFLLPVGVCYGGIGSSDYLLSVTDLKEDPTCLSRVKIEYRHCRGVPPPSTHVPPWLWSSFLPWGLGSTVVGGWRSWRSESASGSWHSSAVLLADVVVPKVSGRELAVAVTAARSKTTLLFLWAHR